jgi:hypothetical protein
MAASLEVTGFVDCRGIVEAALFHVQALIEIK